MSSLKEKAAALPQIDLDAKDQPEIVINVLDMARCTHKLKFIHK